MNENNYLSSFVKDVFSQKGEDGILEKVLEIIKPENKWCVEFGAWDGKLYSNTRNLIKNGGWSAVLIESDSRRYLDLAREYKGNDKVLTLNEFVGFEGENSLDNLLSKIAMPKSFDLLSIDIDGNDYHVWDSVKEFSPQVVIVEFNPTIPADIEFIQKKDITVTQGSSLLAIYNLGKSKGYELVATTELNAIFVKREYFGLFGIKNNSPISLKTHREYETRLSQLYDGTILIHGLNRMLWHHADIKPKHIQIIPKIFRVFPDNMNAVKRLLFKIWRKIHNKIL